MYRCTLLWNGPNCLVIGWADRFKICKIVRRNNLVATSSTHAHGLRGSANAVASTVASTIAATVLSSGAGSFVTSSDKKDFGTYVEISKFN